MSQYVYPELNKTGFHCPFCHTYARQVWASILAQFPGSNLGLGNVRTAHCDHCKKYTIWVEQQMVYPESLPVSAPNSDLGQDVQEDYNEAASIVVKSPRGATALLRLAIQKLCKQLGEKGENINGDIASLVKKGLSPTIQQSLDIVRVVGNNAVHPGQIELKDNKDIALKLFDLVNIIADTMITKPKEIKILYESLPKSSTEQIEKRDKDETQ
jgi:hypothetical protein